MNQMIADALNSILIVTLAWAAPGELTIVNDTGQVVVSLSISPTNEDSWGPDQLGRDILADGAAASISFSAAGAQCLWDVRATLADGTSAELRAANLCQVSAITFRDEGRSLICPNPDYPNDPDCPRRPAQPE